MTACLYCGDKFCCNTNSGIFISLLPYVKRSRKASVSVCLGLLENSEFKYVGIISNYKSSCFRSVYMNT
jgi:hypothetical protein